MNPTGGAFGKFLYGGMGGLYLEAIKLICFASSAIIRVHTRPVESDSIVAPTPLTAITFHGARRNHGQVVPLVPVVAAYTRWMRKSSTRQPVKLLTKGAASFRDSSFVISSQ